MAPASESAVNVPVAVVAPSFRPLALLSTRSMFEPMELTAPLSYPKHSPA